MIPPGIASYRSSEIAETSMLETQQSAGTFSLLCFGSLKKARRGALYRKFMAIGMRSTVDSVDGAMRVFFRHCMNIFTMPVKSLRSSLIRRWCVRIPAQPVLKKNGGQEAQALGRSRGGFTTKLNLSLSDAWVPLRFTLTAGHRNDITQASALIQGYCYEYVIADKAYDSDAFIAEIRSEGGVAVIPPRRNRTQTRAYDKEMYKRRNIIERFFHRLKQYRRVATRYDKLAVRYLGFVYFAAILI